MLVNRLNTCMKLDEIINKLSELGTWECRSRQGPKERGSAVCQCTPGYWVCPFKLKKRVRTRIFRLTQVGGHEMKGFGRWYQ